MVSKTQLAFLLLTCVVVTLLIQPAVSQKDALRWGKRNSDLSDEYAAEIPQARRTQYDYEDKYYGKRIKWNNY